MQIQQNINLQPFNTLAVNCRASYYAAVQNVPALQQLLHQTEYKNLPKLVLGEGSNILFTENFSGLILHNQIKGIEMIDESSQYVFIRCGGGENWHQLVLYCIEKQYAGIENLILIPGTVGAAPIQNIGAYGVELESVFYQCEAIDLQTGEHKIFSKPDCHFGYRNSIFKNELKNRFLITHVTLCLNKTPIFHTEYGDIKKTLAAMQIQELSLAALGKAVMHIRQNKLPDPKKLPNAGSFFKNPLIPQKQFNQLTQEYPQMPFYLQNNQYKIPAAWLIEQCGFKGKRFDHVGVHDQQALILINYNGGTGKELLDLAQTIQQTVLDKFAITLEPEVNIY